MIKEIRNRSVLWKLFISYFLILVIPLIIMTGILYKTSVVDLQKEIENSNMQKLLQIKDSLDMRMKELQYMVFKINNDVSLSPYSMLGNEYMRMEGIKKLSIYKANNAFIEEFYVYYKGSDSVVSSAGQISLSTLTRSVYMFDEEKEKKFIDDINSVKVPTIETSENVLLDKVSRADLISYLYPISQGGGQPYGTVIFMIRKSVFENMIKDLLGDMPGSVFIMDKQKNVIVSFNNGGQPDLIGSTDIINRYSSTGIYNLEINSKKISLIKLISDETGWSFATAMQTSQLFKQATYMKTLILQIVLSIFAFGLFTITVLARKSYGPIRNLISYINSQWSQIDKTEHMNEIDRIRKVIVAAIDQNKELKARMDSQRPLIKDQVLARLIKGEVNDYDAIKELLLTSQIDLSGPFYNVMLIANEKDKGDSEEAFMYRESILLTLGQHQDETKNIYMVDLMYNNSIALIVNLRNLDNIKEYQRNLAQKIKGIIEAQIGGEIVIGIGKVCNDILQLDHAFIEATAAFDAKMIRSMGKIIFFDDLIKREKQIYWYPAEEQLRFIQSLKLGDQNVAFETLKLLMSDISENRASVLMIKYVCFDIINMIIKTVNELNISGINNGIERLMAFSSLDSFEMELRSITEKICGHIEEKKKNEDNELFSSIIDCIYNRFDNYNLGLENISMELKLPVYYLSRFFKDHTNCTFTDYISKLRMEKAKELLLKTELPVKDIVTKIGYTDIPSFMRKFKKIEGITPGQFRKMYSDIEEDK